MTHAQCLVLAFLENLFPRPTCSRLVYSVGTGDSDDNDGNDEG